MTDAVAIGWTEERVERMRNLWRAGSSAGEIAVKLGGVSRCAVMGKIHRLNLTRPDLAEGKPAVAKRRAKRAPAAKPVKVAPPKLKAMPLPKPPPIIPGVLRPEPLNISLTDLAALHNPQGSTCRYISGDPRENVQFCGHNTKPGAPYCEYHTRVCYRPNAKKKKVA